MKAGAGRIIWIICLLILAGAIGAVIANQDAIAKLRADQQELMNAKQEERKLVAENSNLGSLRAENAEVQRLREATKGLPGLRNEVRQLRREAQAIAAMRAENRRFQTIQTMTDSTAQPGGSVNIFSKETIRDEGFSLPRFTLETYFAAILQGNVNRAIECMTPEAARKLQGMSEDAIRQVFAQGINGFTGYEIINRSQPAPGEFDLEIRISPSGDTAAFHIIRTDGGFKIAN